MRTRVSVATMLGFLMLTPLLSVPPPAGAASCTGECNPDNDECCKDDCTWEDENATCIPFNHGESCRRKRCTRLANHGNDNGGAFPTCTRGNWMNEPEHTPCIGTNPCAQGECNGANPPQCINQSPGTNPCEDGNECTTNICTQSGNIGFTCSQSNVAAETACTIPDADPCKAYQCDGNGVCAVTGNLTGNQCGAFPDGSTCVVRTCQDGVCSGPTQGNPVACAAEPCKTRTCVFQNGAAVCQKTNVPRGTVCDTDPWDCTHQRCTVGGQCRSYKATDLKECDRDPSTAAHCYLSLCAGDKTCRTDPKYFREFGLNGGHAFGLWPVEDARTKTAANRHFTSQPICPESDANACTSDRCVGNADACHLYGCEVNQACPVPPCGDVCDIVDGACACRFD